MTQPNPFDHKHSHSLLESISVDEFINYDEEAETEDFVINGHTTNHESSFSPPFTTTYDNNSLQILHHHDIFSFHHINQIVSNLTLPGENVANSLSFDSLDDLNSLEMEEVIRVWLAVDDDETSSLILPTEAMELGSDHLVKAYTEAIENQNRELVEVIVRRVNEKVSPIGEAGERLLYHSFHVMDNQADGYIEEESSKVFPLAFEGVYRILMNGMFAHFGANSAILEAMPRDIELLHMVDFDIGEGTQLSSLIASLVDIQQVMSLKITSIKWKEETETSTSTHPPFEETSRRLEDSANFHGLKLEMEEIEMEDLVKVIKMKNKRRTFLAFNCMWALPHKGRRRSRRRAMEFLDAATSLLAETCNGVITYGEGESYERIINNCSGFESFVDSYMKHYQALLESIEWSFATGTVEARVAIESLFVAPFVSCQALYDMWKEIKWACGGLFGPKDGVALKVSPERLIEAQLMVREGGSLYGVIVDGENSNLNELVLEWRGTSLVRVSAWRSSE